jgi:hypothetical protein
MSDVLATIDPAAALLHVGGRLIDGFAEDGGVKVVKNKPAFNMKVGTTGEAARVRVRDESGYIEITLMQSSDGNDYLSAKHNADLAFGVGTFAVQLVDTLGTTAIDAINCYLEKMPDIEVGGGEAKATVWRVVVPKLGGIVGGNVRNVDS